MVLCLSALLLAGCGKASHGVPAGYPLTKCVISGELLGGMGNPVKVTHDGTDVYLCCDSCIDDFNKEPAKHAQQVKDAAAARK